MTEPFSRLWGLVLALGLIFVPMRTPGTYSFSPDEVRVRTTAYTHSESDHLIYGRKTAIGTTLRYSKAYTSAASDWSRYPVGTEFRIKGIDRHYVIDDYGSALVGKDTIDLYFPSKSAMNKWGAKHVDIVITKHGDFERSKEILSQRTGWKHCRKMHASIEENAKEFRTKESSESDHDAVGASEVIAIAEAPSPTKGGMEQLETASEEASTAPEGETLAGFNGIDDLSTPEEPEPIAALKRIKLQEMHRISPPLPPGGKVPVEPGSPQVIRANPVPSYVKVDEPVRGRRLFRDVPASREKRRENLPGSGQRSTGGTITIRLNDRSDGSAEKKGIPGGFVDGIPRRKRTFRPVR